MTEYHNQDTDFRNWCKENQNGFYLNEKSPREFMFHGAQCDHVGVLDPESSPTKKRKICFSSRAEFEQWHSQRGADVNVVFCTRRICSPLPHDV
jgi:hypothetical protein